MDEKSKSTDSLRQICSLSPTHHIWVSHLKFHTQYTPSQVLTIALMPTPNCVFPPHNTSPSRVTHQRQAPQVVIGRCWETVPRQALKSHDHCNVRTLRHQKRASARIN